MHSLGSDVSYQTGIRGASINMFGSLVFSVPTSKNRPSSQGTDDVCSLPASPATSRLHLHTGRAETQSVCLCVYVGEHQ